jgi:Flp pilus assembly protein TadG
MSQTGHGPGRRNWTMLLPSGQIGRRVRSNDQAGKTTHERGVALVEFAFVALLLFTLIFGIMSYAYMMSLRQSMTQATAEGARAGAVAAPLAAEAAALGALNQALDQHGVSCAEPNLRRSGSNVGTCDVRVVDCATPNGANTAAEPDCVVVEADYQYRAHPLLPSFPGLSLAMPEHVRYSAIAEIN